MTRRVMLWLRGVIQRMGRALGLLILRAPPRETIHGVVVSTAASDHPDVALDRIRAALDLIAQYDSATLSRLQRHFEGIAIQTRRGVRDVRGSPNGLLEVSEEFIVDRYPSSALVASAFARAAMARHLRSLGLRGTPGSLARMGVLCAMAELAFARRLPSATELVARAEGSVDRWSRTSEVKVSERAWADVREKLESKGLLGRALSRFVAEAERRTS